VIIVDSQLLVLQLELGKTASISLYGRENRTPMTFVLDEVERQIGACFSVYWVDDGSPEIFCLPDLAPAAVAFSTSYLSITAFLRKLFVNPYAQDIIVDVSERSCLKLMAELALRKGDSDYAVLAFVKSITNKGIWHYDGDQVMRLEHEPKNEAYMATWFFGLVHELGHLHPYQEQQFSNNAMFSDGGILEAITIALSRFPTYPVALKNYALERAKKMGSDSVLGIDHLRCEGLADMFATQALFQTTIDIMREIKRERFQVAQFISEMIIFLNVIVIVERCRAVAKIASSIATTSQEDVIETLYLHPVSVNVRAMMQHLFLNSLISEYLFGNDPTLEQKQNVEKQINEIAEHYAEKISAVDSGMARAMQFSLFPERRENELALFAGFEMEITNSPIGLEETKRFIKMADGFERDSRLLGVLKDIINPLQPLPI
jgi:hypothetical protein